jgi:hypothetical protein
MLPFLGACPSPFSMLYVSVYTAVHFHGYRHGKWI